jgi:hypothetical protein
MKAKSVRVHTISDEELDRVSRVSWVEVLLPFLSFFLALLFGLVSSFLTKTTATNLPGSDVTLRLLIVLASILLLGLITAGVAGFKRRKNRDVILLKRHLAKIYLSALRSSALNPSLETTISHE